MTAIAPPIEGAELARLLGLLKGADSVELKLTVPEPLQRSAAAALGLDPLYAQIRQVFFFETADLALDRAGVVVRARRIQGKGDDSTVKLRPVVPDELPPRVRQSELLTVEVDAMPGGFVCSASLKNPLGPRAVRESILGGKPIRKLFSREQRRFFAEHAPQEIALDDLLVLGPIFVLKQRWDADELGRRVVAEMWLYPDGSRVLELSTRCATTEAFQVAAETRAYLAEHGIEVGGEQETKTRKALTYFAQDLAATAPIVPRWEWRTFGAEALVGREPERVQESDESYLLSRHADASVKVRDGLMDVKRLQEVDGDGLEQWLPVLKAEFPLAAADLRTVLGALGVEPVELARSEYTFDELVAEVVDPHPDLRAVSLHKHRERHTVDGCTGEQTRIDADGRSASTVAIESEDAAAVAAAVRALGFDPRRNVCVARGLKGLVGFAARYAVIDVGTNSVKFHVGERTDGAWTTLDDRAEVTRLGQGLQEAGHLTEAAVERTVEAVAAIVDEARKLGAIEVAAVGTAGLRQAPNRDDFVAAVERRTGVRVEVIPGEEEARLAYRGATAELELGDGAVVVFDTGGGSSQFTFGHGDGVDEQFSVDVGAARYTERFGLDGEVTPETLAAARAAIAEDLARLDGHPKPDAVVAMGGAVTNLAAVALELAEYAPDVVQGSVLDVAEIDRQIELYRTRTADRRRQVVGLQPKRAEVILAGACIVRTVLEKLGAGAVTVSDRGLRHGLLAERFGA